jgi:hypothetical protein
MAQMKLAEALLRRKELQGKVDQLMQIDTDALVARLNKRVNINDDWDDIIGTVPKVSADSITARRDFYARQLRLVDAAIQHTNWTTEVEVNDSVNTEFTENK